MPLMTLRKRFAATVAAAAIALAGMTAAAVPARADTDTLARILLGAGTIFIIGKAIESENDRKSARKSAAVTRDRYADTYYRDGQDTYYRDGHKSRDGRDYRHDRGNHRGRAPKIPAVCAIDIDRHGPAYYSARCLKREGLKQILPERCEVRVRTSRGLRKAYDGICLQRTGFHLEGQRRRHY